MKIHIKRIDNLVLLDKAIAFMRKSQIEHYIIYRYYDNVFTEFDQLSTIDKLYCYQRGIEKDPKTREDMFRHCYIVLVDDKDAATFKIKFPRIHDGQSLDERRSYLKVFSVAYDITGYSIWIDCIGSLYNPMTWLRHITGRHESKSNQNHRKIEKYLDKIRLDYNHVDTDKSGSLNFIPGDKVDNTFHLSALMNDVFEITLLEHADPTLVYRESNDKPKPQVQYGTRGFRKRSKYIPKTASQKKKQNRGPSPPIRLPGHQFSPSDIIAQARRFATWDELEKPTKTKKHHSKKHLKY